MPIAKVIVGKTSRATAVKIYDYNIPRKLAKDVGFGARVRIPFGSGDRIENAFVVGVVDEKGTRKLKDIIAVDEKNVFSPKMWELAQWLTERYLCSYVEAVNAISPPGRGVVKTTAKDSVIRGRVLAVDERGYAEQLESLAKNATAQRKVLELLHENGFVSNADISKLTGASAVTLSLMEKRGAIESREIVVARSPFDFGEIEMTCDLEATDEQKAVIKELKASVDKRKSGKFLLHGVTGSGKTEVFLQTIRQTVNSGRQAIVLVPEISLTPQMVKRFAERFGNRVAVLHSALSLGERYDEWKRIRNGEVDVAVGARSAIFAPFENLGLIIIDEEHETGYKSEMSPKYSAKEVALRRAETDNATVVFASATPSFESYYRARKGDFVLLNMKKRYNNAPLPECEIVDMRKELEDGNRSIFSRRLREEITKNLERGEKTILFLNRRGFSTFVSCRSCGYVEECPHCKVSLTYHKFDDELVCHYCGFKKPPPSLCPECESKYIRHFGTGTEKVEEEIKREFPNASVIRMDADTTAKKQSHRIILDKFENENIDILLGTQMVTKGLDFSKVTLVGVLAADITLNIDDYRAKERTFDLITQVSGRGGRGETAGRSIIQTYTPESEAITFAKNHDFYGFYMSEMPVRLALCYPPFCDIITVVMSSHSEPLAREALKVFAKEFNRCAPETVVKSVIGPTVAPIAKIKNKHRYRLLIKCDYCKEIADVLRETANKVESGDYKGKIQISIDVNPYNMM